MPTSEQNAWVARVLGVGADAPAESDGFDAFAELEERLADAKIRLQLLVRAGAAEARELAQSFASVSDLVAKRAPDAPDEMLELEDALYVAESAGRARSVSSEIKVPLALRKLMIDWRAAQAAADEGIKALGDAYLCDPEVQEDPRFDDVYEAVSSLQSEVPDFGDGLSDAVDAVFNDGAKTPSIVKASLTKVAEYRTMLNNASILSELESLGSEVYGREFPIARPLSEALDQIETQLKALA